MRERAKYYSQSDLGAGLQLSYAQEVLEAYTPSFVCKDINDAIELHNVKIMISKGMALVAWTEVQRAEYEDKIKHFGKTIVDFYSSIGTSPDLRPHIEILEPHYHQDFWDMFGCYGQLCVVSDDNIMAVLAQYPNEVEKILHCQQIVEQHDGVLRDFLLRYPKAAPILVNAYLKVSDVDYIPFYIPSNLSDADKECIINSYIDGDDDDVSLGIAQMIASSKDVSGLILPPKIRLKAKKKAEKLHEILEKSEDVFRFGISLSVEFSSEKNIPNEQRSFNNGLGKHVYSIEYLNQCDDVKLINVFRELFHYLDKYGLLTLVSNRREDNILEKVDTDEWKGMYRNNQMFDYKNKLALSQLSLYINYLSERGKTIESLIKNYFENHFRKDYGYPSPQLSLAREDETYENKNKIIAPGMEAIVKQYNLYVEEGEIDPELLEMSMPLPVTLAKSLLWGKHKYVVIAKSPSEINRIMWCLFSDQSLLSFVNPFKDSHITTLYELLAKERVQYANYEDYQKVHIDFLIAQHVLGVDSNGYLFVANRPRAIALGFLFQRQEISYWYFEPEIRAEIDKMVSDGWLSYDDYLLSPAERKYFNFFLNSTEFSNGPKLRNNYSHGANSCLESDKEHQVAYYHFLMLLIIILLKMDDDMRLCLYLKDAINHC